MTQRVHDERRARVADAGAAAELVGLLLDLDRQLAGGRQYQHRGAHARLLARRVDVQHARQQEPARLAGA